MYMCMCMYACMYVRKYVCMYTYIHDVVMFHSPIVLFS